MALNVMTEESQQEILGELKAERALLDIIANGYTIEDPAGLQKLCASGQIGKWFSPGDIIYIPWTDNSPSTPVTYQFPFVVVDIADCYDEHDVLHENGLWLMAMYAEPQEIQFDAPEAILAEGTFQSGLHYFTKNGDGSYTEQTVTVGDTIPADTYYVHSIGGTHGQNILRYGYNRWRDSAYRQWLNSDAAKNTGWWTAQHDYDVSPAASMINKAGWLDGFTEDWKAIFKPVKVQTAANTVTDGGVTDVTYDKFFLGSVEQYYGIPQAAGVEGHYWPYWKDETGLTEPKNGSSSDTNDARKIPSVASPTGSAVSVRMRSAYRGYSYLTWYVNSAGYLSSSSATTSSRSQPACVIY